MPEDDLSALVKMFADPLFDPAEDNADGQRDARTYRRLRHVHQHLAEPAPLLRRPAYLRTLLELTAMVDPGLFQVMFLHHCMTVGPALDYGASEEDLAELVSGRSVGAALMTEIGLGNSSSGIRTEAVFDPAGREFVLHTPVPGATKYPPNVGRAGIPRLAVVSARLTVGGVDRGTSLFLVRLRDADGPCPGVRITPRPRTALVPLDYAAVAFDRVRVPFRGWLRDGCTITEGTGEYRDPLPDARARSRRSTSMSRFAWGAVTTGLAAVARAGVAITIRHAERRRTAGGFDAEVPALAHRNQQRLLFPALAAAVGATALARRVGDSCWRIPADAGPAAGAGAALGPGAMRTASLGKVVADRLAERAISRCRAACGAFGFFAENRLIEYQGLAMAFAAAGGDNQLILLDAAWTMADGIDYEPPGDRPLVGSPLEPDGWVGLLAARERLLHRELVERLGPPSVVGEDRGARRRDCVDVAQRFAEAHAARVTMEALLRERFPTLSTAGPGLAEPPVEELCRLLFLDEISSHDGWYLAAGLLTAADVRSLPDRLDDACARLLPYASAASELLGVPLEIVRAPIAGDDYVRDLTTGPASADPGPRRSAPTSTPTSTSIPTRKLP